MGKDSRCVWPTFSIRFPRTGIDQELPTDYPSHVNVMNPQVGVGFIVVNAGGTYPMPRFPWLPAATHRDVDEHGNAVGLVL